MDVLNIFVHEINKTITDILAQKEFTHIHQRGCFHLLHHKNSWFGSPVLTVIDTTLSKALILSPSILTVFCIRSLDTLVIKGFCLFIQKLPCHVNWSLLSEPQNEAASQGVEGMEAAESPFSALPVGCPSASSPLHCTSEPRHQQEAHETRQAA